MDLSSYIGKPTGAGTVHVERGAVSRFATAVTDENPVFHDLKAAKDAGFNAPPVPLTWTFASVFSFLGGHDVIEHWFLAMCTLPRSVQMAFQMHGPKNYKAHQRDPSGL